MSSTDTDAVVVVFRRWPAREGGTVLALFPGIDEGHGMCACYEHVGQHGAADYGSCIARTRPAFLADADVLALRRELESAPYGYRLTVRQRKPLAVPHA